MKPFEFECDHGRYRICKDKVEAARALENGQPVYVRIDQGDPDRINPAVEKPRETMRDKITRRLKRTATEIAARIHTLTSSKRATPSRGIDQPEAAA